MFDFSTAKVRCSSIYNIMAGADSKTNLQKWVELCAEIADKKLRMDSMKKKDGPGYAKIADSLEDLAACEKVLQMAKDEPLPFGAGCKTYLTALYADVKYGKWNPTKDIGSKYTSKGKQAEESSIDLISRLDKQFYQKNQLTMENPWLRGTPDVIVGDDPYNAEKIIDVKSPWDCETFFSNLNGELVAQYKFQMMGYMALTNAPVAEVHFCLVDIPAHLWERERKSLFDRMEVLTEEDIDYKLALAQLFRNLTFGDMPLEERRVKFVVERDEELIQKIYQQVEKCRPYLQEIEKKHLFGVNYAELGKNMVAD
jgi:hypothetical protein